MITKETMERFVEMLKENEIVVVARRIKVNYEMKVIGVHNGLKWDFTPMVAYVTSCRTNGADITHRAVRDISPESIIWRTLKSLRNFAVFHRLIWSWTSLSHASTCRIFPRRLISIRSQGNKLPYSANF